MLAADLARPAIRYDVGLTASQLLLAVAALPPASPRVGAPRGGAGPGRVASAGRAMGWASASCTTPGWLRCGWPRRRGYDAALVAAPSQWRSASSIHGARAGPARPRGPAARAAAPWSSASPSAGCIYTAMAAVSFVPSAPPPAPGRSGVPGRRSRPRRRPARSSCAAACADRGYVRPPGSRRWPRAKRSASAAQPERLQAILADADRRRRRLRRFRRDRPVEPRGGTGARASPPARPRIGGPHTRGFGAVPPGTAAPWRRGVPRWPGRSCGASGSTASRCSTSAADAVGAAPGGERDAGCDARRRQGRALAIATFQDVHREGAGRGGVAARANRLEAMGQTHRRGAHDFTTSSWSPPDLQLLARRTSDEVGPALSPPARWTPPGRGAAVTRRLLAFRAGTAARGRPGRPSRRSCPTSPRTCCRAPWAGPSASRPTSKRGLWPVLADAGELQIALLNAGINGRDAMPGGGVLALSAENVRIRGGAAQGGAPGGLSPGEYVALSVADSGSGDAERCWPGRSSRSNHQGGRPRFRARPVAGLWLRRHVRRRALARGRQPVRARVRVSRSAAAGADNELRSARRATHGRARGVTARAAATCGRARDGGGGRPGNTAPAAAWRRTGAHALRTARGDDRPRWAAPSPARACSGTRCRPRRRVGRPRGARLGHARAARWSTTNRYELL
jgi:hypothetical protein